MPVLALEERVALLETAVLALKRQLMVPNVSEQPWWEQISGTFADTPAFDEAVRLGRAYREAQQELLTQAKGDDVSA